MIREFGTRHPEVVIAGGVLMYAIGPSFIAASSVDGPGFVLLRFAIGMPLMFLIVGSIKLRRRLVGLEPRVTLRSVSPLWTVVASVAFASHHLSFMTAVKLTSVADAALLDALSPLIVMVLAFLMFGERPPLGFIGWSILAMGGAAVVAVAGTAARGGEVLGSVLALWAVISFAAFFLASRAARPTSDTWSFLAMVTTISSVCIIVFFLVTGAPLPEPTSRDVLLALGLAVGSGAIGHFLMTWPLDRLPVNLPPVLRLSTPFLATVVAWVTLGEGVSLHHLIGGGLTGVGVAGAIRSSNAATRVGSAAPLEA